MESIARSKSKRLRELIHRRDKVLAVFHPPSAALGRVLDKAGVEAGFVGTSQVIGSHIGLSDVGTATMTECVQIGGWIAQSVTFPVLLDGDTGHGGIMAVRRLIRECIKAGIAGVRIDDQAIEGKRITGAAGMEVVSIKNAIARYRAAVDMKNELDPNFVIMSHCYARNAQGGSLDDTIIRMRAYLEEGGVDWVQFEYPHNIEEVKRARAEIKGVFSFLKGGLGRILSLQEHMDLGVNIAWYAPITHRVSWASMWRFMQDYNKRDIRAFEDFMANHQSDGFPDAMDVGPDGEGIEKQRMLEERYFPPEMLGKYT